MHSTPLLWLRRLALPTLLLLTGLAYLRVLDADFVVWDDLALIIHNPLVDGFHPAIFWTFEPELYAPLALLSFQFEHWLVGFEPTLFHATNLFLHLINVYLVYLLLTAFPRANRQTGKPDLLAIFATALFALHPVQVETIAWVSARKELLWTLFGLLALLNHLRDQQQSPYAIDRYAPQKIQTLLWVLLALLSKPTAVIVPLLIILLDANKLSLKNSIITHRYLLLLSFIFGALALLGKSDTDLALSIFQRLGLLCMGLFFSIKLIVWPAGLAALHPALEPVSLLSLPYVVAGIATVIFGVALWRLRKKIGRCAFAITIFILSLLPGLLSPVHAQTVTVISEHYLYFPMIGIALLAMFGIENIATKLQSQTKKIFGSIGILVLLCIISIFTYNQVSVWRDSPTLFTSVRKLYPRSVAVLTNLGTAYAQMEMYGEAESVLRQAIGINPDAIQARFNYAGLRYVKGNYVGAIEEYKHVLDRAPLHQDALRMLTWSYYRTGEVALAEETYDYIIHLNPSLRSQLPSLDIPPERKSM